MKLARRLTLALLVGILVGVAANDYRAVGHDIADFEGHVADDLSLIARGLSFALAELTRVAGPAAAERLISDRNQEGNVSVRWILLDAPKGDPRWADLDPSQVVALRQGLEVHVVRSRGKKEGRLFIYRAFQLEAPIRDVIEVSESLAPVHDKERRNWLGIVVKSAVILVLGGLYSLALGVRFVAQPIESLIAQARRVGAGDLSQRLTPSRRDEIGELAGELNAMCDRLEESRRLLASEMAAKLAAVEQLRHADRLKTVGQLASGIAHELGTPLNVVAGHAKLIAAIDATRDESVDSARIIVEQTARITAIIRQLLDFARRGSPTFSIGSLDHVVGRAVEMLSHLGMQKQVEIEFDGEEARVKMDAGQIQQAVMNLILNGIQAMPNGGHIRVGIGRERVQPPATHGGDGGDYVRLSVIDEGVGIAAEQLSRIFEPFFTTKGVGEGTGLGLSVTYGIVEEHGGWIAVASTPGRGSCFSIFLPGAR